MVEWCLIGALAVSSTPLLHHAIIPCGCSHSEKTGDGFAGVGEPQQSQAADDQNLADHRKAVDQKGRYSASNSRFGQI